jgi:hypothetical protein
MEIKRPDIEAACGMLAAGRGKVKNEHINERHENWHYYPLLR